MAPPIGELTSGQRGVPEIIADAKEFVVFQHDGVEMTGCQPTCVQCRDCSQCQPVPTCRDCQNCQVCQPGPNLNP